MLDRIFKFFCSLRLTVALLGLGLVLVFVGTLAQVHEGLYDAQVRYFKSWAVSRPTIGDSKWPIVLPGGYLLGMMLLLNLLAAHIKRFRFTWKKLGIHLIHGGLVLLLVGQLLTDLFSRESYMRLAEGSSRSYSEDARANELALVDLSDPKGDRVTTVPESVLAKKGEINDPALPVTLRVLNYWPNADIEPVPPPEAVVVNATAGVYTNRLVMPLPESSTAEDARAATLVEVVVGGKSLGTFLVLEKSDEIQTFAAGGQELGMSFLFAPMLGGNVLAISPAGNANMDNLETFSEKDLARKGTLASKKGAFTLNVKEFWPKCRLYRKPQANSVRPKANHGMLAGYFVTPEPVATDTDSRNMPAVEVELVDGKNSLGIWLLWTWPTRSNEPMIELVKIGGRNYQMAFEFKRYYAPYQLGLIKFTQDKYKGTEVAKNFSSRVRLQNPLSHEDREVLIKMNTPLRYAGTTYYQASFHEGAQVDSVLEVVTNPGWLTPYLACVLVGAGFGFTIRHPLIWVYVQKENCVKLIWKIMPWFFLALFAMEIAAVLAPKKEGVFHLRAFGALPVLMNGRVQPFDSVGRNSLLQIRSTADLPLEIVPGWKFWQHAEKIKSTAWLLEVMCQPRQADERAIFLIHNPDLLGELKLDEKGVENSGLRYYTFNQLKPLLPEIFEQSRRAEKIDNAVRTPLERQVVKLGNAVHLYQKLKQTLNPPGAENFLQDLDAIKEAIPPGIAAFNAKQRGEAFDQKDFDRLYEILAGFDELRTDPAAGQSYPLVIPPPDPKTARDDWGNAGFGVIQSIRAREIYAPLGWLTEAAAGYRDDSPATFNQAVSEYTKYLAEQLPEELAKGRREFFLQRSQALSARDDYLPVRVCVDGGGVADLWGGSSAF